MKDNIVLSGVISKNGISGMGGYIEYKGWPDLWNGKITIIKKRVEMPSYIKNRVYLYFHPTYNLKSAFKINEERGV